MSSRSITLPYVPPVHRSVETGWCCIFCAPTHPQFPPLPPQLKVIQSLSPDSVLLSQHPPLDLGGIDTRHPLKPCQPPRILLHLHVALPLRRRHILKRRIPRPLQTPLRDLAVDLDVLDQCLEADVVVLGPDEPQDQQVQRRAVEVAREVVQDVDLHRPHRVLVVRVVSDAEHRRVDLRTRVSCVGRRWRRGAGCAAAADDGGL